MTRHDIARMFTRAYNGHRNLMTPNVVEHGEVGDYVYELAWGSGIAAGTKMYGVTMLTKHGEKTDHNHGGWKKEEEARNYLAQFE